MSTGQSKFVDRNTFPRYGEIWDVTLEPVIGSEIGKQRPTLVFSNDINNEHSSTVTVIPMTSQPVEKNYPFEVHVPKGMAGLTADSRIKADQIRTVDKRRFITFRGLLPPDYLPLVEKALRIHLNMK
jgi:mRNA interferase MazF